MNTVILLSPRRERTSLAKTIIVMSLSILWDVLDVYESYILDEPPFLYFKWLLSSIYWKFIFEEKMINFPTLMNTIMEWRGSNCFGHHYFMYFKTNKTRQFAKTSALAARLALLGGMQLRWNCQNSYRLNCFPDILLTPLLDFFLNLYLF